MGSATNAALSLCPSLEECGQPGHLHVNRGYADGENPQLPIRLPSPASKSDPGGLVMKVSAQLRRGSTEVSLACRSVPGMAGPAEIEVRRSARRRRTLTVTRERGRLIALVPQRMTKAQEAELLPPLVERFLRREARTGARLGDDELAGRAQVLYRSYLGDTGVPMPPVQVSWVDNQQRRWGSCTTPTGQIRLSSRLRSMPPWVLDYVLLHELAHLLQPNHSAAFHALIAGYPKLEAAKAYLAGYQNAVDAGAAGRPADLDEDCQL